MPSGGSRQKAPVLPCSTQDIEALHHREHHLPGKGSYLKTVVFGGLDGKQRHNTARRRAHNLRRGLGLSGSLGGHQADSVPLAGDHSSLGVLNGLRRVRQLEGRGRLRELREGQGGIVSARTRLSEIDHCPEIEQKEMFDIYTSRYKFSGPDAHALVQLTFKHRVGRAHAQEFFLRHMMIEELGIMLEEDATTPIKNSLLMGGSFAVMGMFPLLGYVVLLFMGDDRNSPLGFLVTVSFSLLGSASLGYFKVGAINAQGTYLKQSKLRSALFMTLNGVAVGLTSYVLGLVLSIV